MKIFLDLSKYVVRTFKTIATKTISTSFKCNPQ